ncbi:AraC family transcriptional regulator [Paenibacillus methanolicus]|uniref:AraC-like DNA-binding protein n=1 Tax=Paenibacillus methanolicus TaxID=582686 RepID=A0A5S5C0S3_9BACL|nr:AraC family transcriptional regulator [Paenibacillus methanolicus]TYP72046.1 AraC-like DNA-binding protein [Paenibacillus methanolicus]
MQPIRKPFRLDPLFPFELVHRGIRYSENELPDHVHDLYELVYIHEGKGTFFIDQALYDKGPGDLFLIPGNTVHRAFPSADEPIMSTALFFAPSFAQPVLPGEDYRPLRSFEIARQRQQYKFTLSEPVRTRIEANIAAMASEWHAKAPGYRHAMWLQAHQVLLELSRLPIATAPAPSPESAFAPRWVQQALRDIDRDPVRCGGLASLSAAACVSPGHFSRVFKQLTGMNVTDYVNAKRLVRAKELLLTTDDNIETIALVCGFQGMRHFYHQFRKLTGVTPLTYRRRMKE